MQDLTLDPRPFSFYDKDSCTNRFSTGNRGSEIKNNTECLISLNDHWSPLLEG